MNRALSIPLLGTVAVLLAGIMTLLTVTQRLPEHRNAPGAAIDPSDAGATASADRREYRILFGGDMMFDRWIRTQSRRKGNAFVFDGLRHEFDRHDLVVANLEGPISDHPSVSETSAIGSADNYRFTFDPSWAATLHDAGISPVFLGNNHILNQGEEGLRQTKALLTSASVAFFGDPVGEDRVFVRELDGLRLALVGYDEFTADASRRAFKDIALVRKQADIVILYAHWGTEYEPVRSDVRALAHSFIDAGCDAVIGSHPHIVQEREEYAGKTIYYSLGNLIFDQYLRDDTRQGLLVSMTIDPETNRLSFREIPVSLRSDGSTSLVTD